MLENILNLGKTVLPEYAQGESSLSDSLSSKGRSKETFEGEQWNPIYNGPLKSDSRLSYNFYNDKATRSCVNATEKA